MYKLMKFEIMFFQDWLVSWSSLIGMHFNPVDSKQMFNIKFAMTGFKPRVFGVGIDCSANPIRFLLKNNTIFNWEIGRTS